MSAANFRSALRDIAWPALPDEIGARMLALQFQFEESERWAEADIQAQQFRQVAQLVAFCQGNIPFWRDRLRRAGLRPGQDVTPQLWARLPILSQSEATQAGIRLRPAQSPPDHGGVQPGPVAATELALFLSFATELRRALWHDVDVTLKRAATILPASGAGPAERVDTTPNWGVGFTALVTGSAISFDPRLPPTRQIALLRDAQAGVLITSPANATRLAAQCRATGDRLPDLRVLMTEGDPLPEADRALCQEIFAVPAIDAWRTTEAGLLSVACPEHGAQHVMAETTLLEVLDTGGRPCAPGRAGRVVVTPLHNLAQPLLRFDTGFAAALAPPCPCGRSLPVLTGITRRA